MPPPAATGTGRAVSVAGFTQRSNGSSNSSNSNNSNGSSNSNHSSTGGRLVNVFHPTNVTAPSSSASAKPTALAERPEFTTLIKAKARPQMSSSSSSGGGGYRRLAVSRSDMIQARRDHAASAITYEGVLHDLLVMLKSLLIRVQAAAYGHDPSVVLTYVLQTATEHVADDAARVVGELEALHGDSPAHHVTAYAEMAVDFARQVRGSGGACAGSREQGGTPRGRFSPPLRGALFFFISPVRCPFTHAPAPLYPLFLLWRLSGAAGGHHLHGPPRPPRPPDHRFQTSNRRPHGTRKTGAMESFLITLPRLKPAPFATIPTRAVVLTSESCFSCVCHCVSP